MTPTSNKVPWLVAITAGVGQLISIQEAKRTGLNVLALDNDEKAWLHICWEAATFDRHV